MFFNLQKTNLREVSDKSVSNALNTIFKGYNWIENVISNDFLVTETQYSKFNNTDWITKSIIRELWITQENYKIAYDISYYWIKATDSVHKLAWLYRKRKEGGLEDLRLYKWEIALAYLHWTEELAKINKKIDYYEGKLKWMHKKIIENLNWDSKKESPLERARKRELRKKYDLPKKKR